MTDDRVLGPTSIFPNGLSSQRCRSNKAVWQRLWQRSLCSEFSYKIAPSFLPHPPRSYPAASPQRLPDPRFQPAAPAPTRAQHRRQPSALQETTLPVAGQDAFAQENVDPHKIK